MAEKPLVFLIHGMGVHKAGWSRMFRNKFAEKALLYRPQASLEDDIEFAEITYDQVFRDAIQNWAATNTRLLSEIGEADREMAEQAVGWLDGMGEEERNPIWTQVADVLLWRLSPFFSFTVRTHVAKCIAEKLRQRMGRDGQHHARASIISHSLGTSVIHDVLADFAHGRYTGDNAAGNGFNAEFFRFESLHTIANVSRVLERSESPVYTSRVRPGRMGDKHSYCKHFYNYRNKWDPFTCPKPFEPPWEVRWYHDKPVAHLYGENPHSITHYVENPLVHIPMLRGIFGRFKTVTPAQELDAIDHFSQIGPLEGFPTIEDGIDGQQEYKDLVYERFADLNEKITGAMGGSPDIIDFIKGLTLFLRNVPKIDGISQ